LNPAPLNHLFQEELYQFDSPAVVILGRPWHGILEEHRLLLAKILSAIKLNIESVTIVEMGRIEQASLAGLNSRKILVFGSVVVPEIPAYEVVEREGVLIVRADDFSQLDDSRKKNLWNALKQMFSV